MEEKVLERAFCFLEEERWSEANQLLEAVLDKEPENPYTYLGKLMIQIKAKTEAELNKLPIAFNESIYYKRIMRFGNAEFKEKIATYAKKDNTVGNIEEIAKSKEDLLNGSDQIIVNDENFLVFREDDARPNMKNLIIYGCSRIPKAAFKNCTSLESVIFLDAVKSIDTEAFSGCSSLKNITLPRSIQTIGTEAFYDVELRDVFYMGNLEDWCKVHFEKNATNYGAKNLYLEGKLTTELIIPNTVKSLEEACFAFSSLTKIQIPNSVTSLGDSLFLNCSSITNIILPSSIKKIKAYAFSGCNSLTSITIPATISHIEDGVFERCSSLKEVTMPSSITSIGKGAFSNCTTLSNITLPKSIESIEEAAFSDCVSLKNITIPDSVRYIGEWAFSGCKSLASITIPATISHIKEWMFERCSSLKEVTMPSTITFICDHAFSDCTSLKSITIPDSVRYIKKQAFSGCTSLSNVRIGSGITSIDAKAFFNSDQYIQFDYNGTTKQWKNVIGDSSYLNDCPVSCIDAKIINTSEEEEASAVEYITQTEPIIPPDESAFLSISFSEKIRALFTQILMLPLSALVQASSGLGIAGLVYAIVLMCQNNPAGFFGLIIYPLCGFGTSFLLDYAIAIPYAKFMHKIKKIEYDGEGYWSEHTGTVTRDIYDNTNTKIGSYETQGTINDYTESDDQKSARGRGMLALPLRLISIGAAIIGLFTNDFFVRIRGKGLKNTKYNSKLHLWLDIVYPKK